MPTDYVIRVSTAKDTPGVTELLEASYPALMPGSYDDNRLAAVLPMMTSANPELLSSGTYYLAESSHGDIVGCGGWSRERPGGGNTEPGLAHIRHFGTHPDWLRRGIARAIVTRCLADARRSGVQRFECYASLNAENFYAAMEFQVIRRMDVQMGPTVQFPCILMERRI